MQTGILICINMKNYDILDIFEPFYKMCLKQRYKDLQGSPNPFVRIHVSPFLKIVSGKRNDSKIISAWNEIIMAAYDFFRKNSHMR